MTGAGAPADSVARGPVNPPYDPDERDGLDGSDGLDGLDGPDPTTDPDRHHEPPDELLTLLELHADGQPRLEASVVADICHHDRALILRLIRAAEEQTLARRVALDDARGAGDAEGARAVTGELRGWETTVRDLRGALRHVVTFGGEEEGRAG